LVYFEIVRCTFELSAFWLPCNFLLSFECPLIKFCILYHLLSGDTGNLFSFLSVQYIHRQVLPAFFCNHHISHIHHIHPSQSPTSQLQILFRILSLVGLVLFN